MDSLAVRIQRVKGYEKTKKTWRTKYKSAEFIEASGLNFALFGMGLNQSPNCQCIEDLFFYINHLTDEKLTQKTANMNRSFNLKAGVVLALHGFNQMVTNDNLTDELALKILKKYPSHIVSFNDFPEDWEKQVAKLKETAETPEGGAAAGSGAGSGNEDLDAKIAAINKMKKPELAEKLTEGKYPVEDWEFLTVPQMKEYYIAKLKETAATA